MVELIMAEIGAWSVHMPEDDRAVDENLVRCDPHWSA